MLHNDSDNKNEDSKQRALSVLQAQGFLHVKEVAAGVTGFASVFKFDATKASSEFSEAMQGVVDAEGYFIGKMQLNVDTNPGAKKSRYQQHAEETFANEAAVASGPLRGHTKDQIPQVAAIEVAVSGASPVRLLAVQPIYMNAKTKDFSTLEDYMDEFGKHHQNLGDAMTPDEKQQLAKTTADQFGALFASKQAAISQVHDLGLLHLDAFGRNDVLTSPTSLKIIDYGNALPMDASGNTADKKFPINPLTGYTSETVTRMQDQKVHTKSIQDDFYTCRTAIVDSLAGYMGITASNDQMLLIHFAGLPMKFSDVVRSDIETLLPGVDIADTKTCIDQMVVKRESLQPVYEEISRARAELEGVNREKAELFDRRDELEEKSEELQEQLSEIEEELLGDNDKVQELDAKITELQENDDMDEDQEAELDQLIEEREALVETTIAALKSEQPDKVSEYENLQEEIAKCVLSDAEDARIDELADRSYALGQLIDKSSARIEPVERVLAQMHKEGTKQFYHTGSAERLQNSFNNLEQRAMQLAAKNDVRGEVGVQMLAQYCNYLTSLPPSVSVTQDLAAVRQEEQRSFAACQKSQPQLSSSTAKLGAVLGHTAKNKVAPPAEPAAARQQEVSQKNTTDAQAAPAKEQQHEQEGPATRVGPGSNSN